MLTAFLSLIACQLAGELIRQALHLPIPGPVIGMFLLAAGLASRPDERGDVAIPRHLDRLAGGLISSMGLLFVPAGVGIIAQGDLLRQAWLPLAAGVVGSTIIGVITTGAVMHWATRSIERKTAPISAVAHPAE